MKVSRNPTDRLRKPKTQAVGLATIYTNTEGVHHCSCGWRVYHARTKVREERAQKHIDKKHDGRGIWL